MEKMTIHRALAELKLIDAKIEKQINEVVPSGIVQKGKLVNGYVQEHEFEKYAISKFDSVKALIERKHKIKSGIVLTNSKTMVTIGKASMTISDAINFKKIIEQKKKLIVALKSKHQAAVADLNRQNEIVNANVQKLLEATFGKENVKVGKEDVDAVRKPFLDANEYHLVDPLKVDNIVDNLEKEVSEFEAEVDAVLSEINAVTFIEI